MPLNNICPIICLPTSSALSPSAAVCYLRAPFVDIMPVQAQVNKTPSAFLNPSPECNNPHLNTLPRFLPGNIPNIRTPMPRRLCLLSTPTQRRTIKKLENKHLLPRLL